MPPGSPSRQTSDGKDRRLGPIAAIFLTVFVDMLGFAMFIPDLQLRGEGFVRDLLRLGPNATDPRAGLLLGVQIAAFSIAQLLTAPILGRLSDRHGRRSVLLVSSALSVAAYATYAFAPSYGFLVLSRALSGVAAGNLGVAFAYVADVTRPEERAKTMGLLGAAFGVGFIVGPSLGVGLLVLGRDRPVLLGLTAAGLALLNFLFVVFLVPESRVGDRDAAPRSLVGDLRAAFATRTLALLLLVFFLVQLGFTGLETTYFRLLETPRWIFAYGQDAKRAGAFVLAGVGITAAFVQGFLIRKLPTGTDERRVLRWAYALFVPSLAIVPFLRLPFPGLLAVVGLGLANGFAQPTLSSLISRNAPVAIVGGIFGVTQALGALARILGPLLGNPLFDWRPWAPYVGGALIAFVPAVLVWRTRLDLAPQGDRPVSEAA